MRIRWTAHAASLCSELVRHAVSEASRPTTGWCLDARKDTQYRPWNVVYASPRNRINLPPFVRQLPERFRRANAVWRTCGVRRFSRVRFQLFAARPEATVFLIVNSSLPHWRVKMVPVVPRIYQPARLLCGFCGVGLHDLSNARRTAVSGTEARSSVHVAFLIYTHCERRDNSSCIRTYANDILLYPVRLRVVCYR